MDADHNKNLTHEIVGQASLPKPENVCYKHACSSSGAADNAFAHAIAADKPQKSVNEISNEDFDLHDPRKANGRVYKGQMSKWCLGKMPPLACKGVGMKDALAGLIFMSNDKVRRSYFKYGVLGMPLARKPIVDRVKIGTKLFLFEFEARFLWGIFEATTEASLDIEKDAYCGSHVPFPAQVRFKVIRECKPLPESYFQLAIKDNYFSPIKFSFELTRQQVSKLMQLYDLQVPSIGKVVGATSFPAKDNFCSEQDIIDDIVEVDSKMDREVHIGIREKGRLLNMEEHDNLEKGSLNLENSHVLKTSDEVIHCADAIQRNARLAMRSLFNPKTTAKSANKNISNTKFELFQADNPVRRIGKAEPLHYPRETTHESQREGMSDIVRKSPMGVMKHKGIFEGSVEDRYLQHELKVGPLIRLQPCKCKESDRDESLLQHPLCGYGDPFIIESCEYSALHSNTNLVGSPSVCVKCRTNNLQRDQSLQEQDNAPLSDYHLVYSKVSLPAQNSSRSPGIYSFPSVAEIVQQDVQPTQTKEILDSNIKAYNLLPANPVKERDNVLKVSEVHAREVLEHTDNSCLTSTSANAREVTAPDDKAWSKDHSKSFLVRSEANFHPCKSTTPDGEARQQHKSHPCAMGQGEKHQAENSMCFTRREPLESNGIRQVTNDDITHAHMSEDDKAWLERARNTVLNSLNSRSNNITAYRRREQEAHMQIEGQEQRLQLLLGKRSWLAASSDPSTSNNDAKPRRSVWSRLSVPRKSCHPVEVVLPNGKFG